MLVKTGLQRGFELIKNHSSKKMRSSHTIQSRYKIS